MKPALYLSLVVGLLCLPPFLAGARQGDPPSRASASLTIKTDGVERRLYDRSYALVVGASNYQSGWPSLPSARTNAERVARELEILHGFQVMLLLDPDAEDLDRALDSFRKAYGQDENNRLLFYFAGHGHTARAGYDEDAGYFVPVDAPHPVPDPAGFKQKALNLSALESYARLLRTRHALFIFDSEFSVSTLFYESRGAPAAISSMTARPSRQFIVAGKGSGLKPGVFTIMMLEALRGEADLNLDSYITATELGEFLRDTVPSYSGSGQRPHYGKIRDPYLNQGDFVFASPHGGMTAAHPTPTPSAYPTPRPTPRPERVVLERYPHMDAPPKVEVGVRFDVKVSLNTVRKSAATDVEGSPSGAISVEVPEAERWKITVSLLADGFKVASGGGDVSSFVLPRHGDSDEAVFSLIPEKIDAPQRERTLYATLWHGSKYIGRIKRAVTVMAPARRGRRDADSPGDAAPHTFRPAGFLPARFSDAAEPRPTPTPTPTPAGDAKDRPAKFDPNAQGPDMTVRYERFKETPGKVWLVVATGSKLVTDLIDDPGQELRDRVAANFKDLAQMGTRDVIAPTPAGGGGSITPRERAEATLNGFGEMLYERYVPRKFKDAFWERVNDPHGGFKTIQVYTNDPSLPWELIRPVEKGRKRGLLGIEFTVSRWHIVRDDAGNETPPSPLVLETMTVVAPDYKNSPLPAQADELRALESFGFMRMPGQISTFRMIAQDFPPAIIHFAGHGKVKGGTIPKHVISLEDGELDPQTWEAYLPDRSMRSSSFFFFNACEVGQIGPDANFVFDDSWVTALLNAGAGGYIGALWPVGDRGAAEFSKLFYKSLRERLARGQPTSLPELLRETRQGFLRNGDTTFMAYVIYGGFDLSIVSK
ncbi:MAG TPA: caspase family protein [Pyrinomonadaceae bacterium]|nr:caspase family protein [Pyrinomonadaceae bacterium]